MIMRIMFHLGPASKAAARQEKYPAHGTGRNGVTGRFFYKPMACTTSTGREGAALLQAGGLHYINGAGRVKNAVKLYWNVVDVGYLHYLCLEIIK